jgi:phosphoglycolate phosphatase-like HAD superfamily hydrolase
MNAKDKELAARFLPHIYFDEKEPFFPVLIGVTVFDKPGRSPSYNRSFDFTDPLLGKVIEYAIYWDYDIGHLYELEHIWVYVGKDGGLYDADASFHGRFMKGLLPDRSNIEDETHVVAYSQPGKHAFFPMALMMSLLPGVSLSASKNAGSQGLLQTAPFRGRYEVNEERNNLVTKYLQRFAFIPTMKFVPHEMSPDILISWEELSEEVPKRIEIEMKRIRETLAAADRPFTIPDPARNAGKPSRKTVIFLDSGDTIIDESTEIRNDFNEVISAEAVPGSVEAVRALYDKGYRLCLVADGKFTDFKNLMIQHGIDDCFEAFAVSECVREQKPSPRMFKAAMGAMLLTGDDIPNIVMVGNNLRKDIKGAKQMGITGIHMNWSPRYTNEPQSEDERPDYTVSSLTELVSLIEKLENK